jgi:hypothetical protein
MWTPLQKVERDPAFRLTDADRERMRRFFDLDALERLLSHVPPERRPEILESFQIPQSNEVRELWFIDDPELQEMLEEVWAPFWMRMPLETVEMDDSERPGKRLAIARRHADPFPQDVLRMVLSAIEGERWSDVSRWIDPPTDESEVRVRMSAPRAKLAPASLRNPTILGLVPEGAETVHLVYRIGADDPAKVLTAHRTSQGWRLRYRDFLSQL